MLGAAAVLASSAPASAQDDAPKMVPWEEVTPPPVTATPAPPEPGAGPDTVWLKDGSATSGTIVLERPDDYVSMRLADGNVAVIRWSEIEKIDHGTLFKPAAPPPKPVPVAPRSNDARTDVHLDGASTLTLEQQDDREWREVCHAPCDVRLLSDATYRIRSDGTRTSRPFKLSPRGGRALLQLDPQGDGSHGSGVGLVVTGALLAPLGLLLAGSNSGSNGSILFPIGVVSALAGIGLLIGGGVLLGSGGSGRVRQPLADPAASMRSPTWSTGVERTASSGTTFTVPIFSGTF
ncbi:MAG TPA: hypothetical protein VF316_02950 [Polyangiaceae bacterium]